MQTIKQKIEDFNISADLFDSKALMFDIETLGLSATYYPIYMIGYMCLEEGLPTITLLFADSQKEEYNILLAFKEIVDSHERFITFNGATFDIPYIEKRAAIHNIFIDIPKEQHLDLFRFIKPFKSMLGLKSLRQKAIEENLGLYREDKYDGGYLIGVYHSYENYRNDEDLSLLILHNLEDIKGMAYILPILSLSALAEGDFTIDSVNSTDLNTLVFYGSLPHAVPREIRIIENGIHIKISGESIVGSLDTISERLFLFHRNYKDYFYLPMENIIIPKSLATTIPADKKTKATKENCRTAIDGYYFRLPTELNGKSKGNKIKSYFNSSDMTNMYLCRSSFDSKDNYLFLYKKDSPDFSGLSEKIKKILFFFIKEG